MISSAVYGDKMKQINHISLYTATKYTVCVE